MLPIALHLATIGSQGYPAAMTRPSRPNRYLALGDSYSIGEGVNETARWPVLLARALTASGTAISPPRIVATTGWTTGELLYALDRAELDAPYALVSLLVGVNNQYRGLDLSDYRAEFRSLVDRAVGYAGGHAGRVLVVSIPDWGVTRAGHDDQRDARSIAEAINAFNVTGYDETTRAGCRFVDITALSRTCGDDPTMLADDGLHPSALQYRRWLPPIFAAARQCLQQPGC